MNSASGRRCPRGTVEEEVVGVLDQFEADPVAVGDGGHAFRDWTGVDRPGNDYDGHRQVATMDGVSGRQNCHRGRKADCRRSGLRVA